MWISPVAVLSIYWEVSAPFLVLCSLVHDLGDLKARKAIQRRKKLWDTPCLYVMPNTFLRDCKSAARFLFSKNCNRFITANFQNYFKQVHKYSSIKTAFNIDHII